MSVRKLASVSLLARLVMVSVGCTFGDGADDRGVLKEEDLQGIEDCTAAAGVCLVYEAEDCTGFQGCSVVRTHGGGLR